MVSSESSEQQLKSLDHSKEDPNTLLDEAASIAGISYDEITEGYTHFVTRSKTDVNTFREQWLLKWVMRKLNEAMQAKPSHGLQQDLKHFLTNTRTWSLLSYLMTTIPGQKTLDILIERNFTKSLTYVSLSLCDQIQRDFQAHSVKSDYVQEPDRPRKRLRLSPSPEQEFGKTRQTNSTESLNSSKFITVIETWAKLLQSSQQENSTVTRSVPPAWAESVKDAAALIAQILALIRLRIMQQAETAVDDQSAFIITQWLQLWNLFSGANHSVDQKAVHKIFNEACLIPCLRLYTLLKQNRSPVLADSMKEMERQIALYTVLPMRSAFNTRYGLNWNKDRHATSWQDIEPIYNMIHEHLGSSITTTVFGEHSIPTLEDPKWASCLTSIAVRLFPRDDIRKRMKEAAWLEVLSLCLAHMAFPRSMPRMFSSSSGGLQPGPDDLPPGVEAPDSWPTDLLAVISDEEIRVSSSSALYLVCSIFSWRERPLPIPLVSQVVSLFPGIFTLSNDDSRSASAFCLDNVFVAIAEHKYLGQNDYRIVVEDILCRLMEALIKARDWTRFLSLWLPNLGDALQVRAGYSFSPDNIPSSLVFDDERLFSKFAELCSVHAAKNFGLDLMFEVLDDLEHMSSKIGPTTDIFAKLAILESILSGRGKELMVIDGVYKALESTADLLVLQIKQPTSFQGQRWRLWSLLLTLHQIDNNFHRFSAIESTMEGAHHHFYSTQIRNIESLQQDQRIALLMEQHMIFSLLTSYHDSQGDNSELREKVFKLLGKAVRYLATMIQMDVETQATDSESTPAKSAHTLWDGHLNSIRTSSQLIDGHLGKLLQEPQLIQNEGNMDEILKPLTQALSRAMNLQQPLADGGFSPTAIAYLNTKYPRHENIKSYDDNQDLNQMSSRSTLVTSAPQVMTRKNIDSMAAAVFDEMSTVDDTLKLAMAKELSVRRIYSLESALSAATFILNVDETELATSPDLVKEMASWVRLQDTGMALQHSQIILLLDVCTLTLKLLPGIVNQALIDRVLNDLTRLSSSMIKIQTPDSQTAISDPKHDSSIIFDRLIGVMDILLTRYRRRLTGRTHLLLPVLQNFLKCFFYTPSRAYLYQNPATSRQKQEFRSSLPQWLDQALPASSAEKLSRVISSICNPTAASARSANKTHHQHRNEKAAKSLQLNDETRKAKRIAAQYMQYLIIEFARSSLDGVIQPEVREKLMPGLYSILDAMDKDLMRAMNSAMDPSSRAIFKGLYDDWVKYWKWDNN